MLFALILQKVFSLTGELVPEGNKDLRLADSGTKKLGWIAVSDLGKNKDVMKVEYDADKKFIKVNGKTLCTGKSSKNLSFCENDYIFTKWETFAEDGKYKFKTDGDFCLSVGKKTDSFNPVIIVKCKPQNIYQRFQYEKNSFDMNRIDTIKNDYDEGAPVILNMALKAYDMPTPVEVIIHDPKDGNKRINTTIGELNSLFAFNHSSDPISHDMLVDTTKANQDNDDQ